MDTYRRQGRQTELPAQLSEEDAIETGESPNRPDDGLDVQDTQAMIETSLSRLNERYAQVLRLRLLDGRSREECADILGVKVGTFDVLLHRAAKAFRKVYPP